MGKYIKSIERNVEWPGQLSTWGGEPQWDDLRAELLKLTVNGRGLKVLLEDPSDVAKAQAVCSSFCNKLNGKKQGWHFQTRSEGAMLQVYKRATIGKHS